MKILSKIKLEYWGGLIALIFLTASNNQEKTENMNIYDIEISSLMGESIDMNQFKGKHILFVNVASECGYTRQYEPLQKLHQTYGDQLTVIGVPCNQFGGQEPGDASTIQSFCSKNYGVDFLMTEKVEVKGENQHPLYQWLTKKSNNGVEDTQVQWNFNKYLIDGEGNYVAYYASGVDPLDEKITSNLK